MLPDLHVAPHWPLMQAPTPCETHQDATRILNEIRGKIVAYRRECKDWRYEHAQTDYIVNVVAGLIADARAIDALHEASAKAEDRLEERIKALESKLAESKRPFSAQMEMQNRRIIALTAELDKLRLASTVTGHPNER